MKLILIKNLIFHYLSHQKLQKLTIDFCLLDRISICIIIGEIYLLLGTCFYSHLINEDFFVNQFTNILLSILMEVDFSNLMIALGKSHKTLNILNQCDIGIF